MKAFCDFDGTISTEDVTDLVLDRFALPQWHEVEARWEQGEINSRDCMKAQVRLIRATLDDLSDFLDGIAIDREFKAFKQFCDRKGISVTVVSDGVDYFIRRILANHGILDVEIIANRMIRTVEGDNERFDLAFPHAAEGCMPASGVCKCRVIGAHHGPHIYVGDGRSDFCVSHNAELVFAKAKLVAYCEENRIPFIPYSGFADVLSAVDGLIRKMPAPLKTRAATKTA
ncbi:MtnX-like HAD-IB family phosphatase [Rhizobium paknamense]|uniref:2,3-diketo-5-methylthio-1-phosphopentane phosphatase n=1 Tax=Rhizobium paknamense TaxID=1206817 RepID=A0ABU0IBZ6_9HYPH|nr:MtnX-like HAD-IB family phosphatase [Rhizobium paknamense]MDQ0455746.1 2,3-diketo-5-methylthio-1-phosphopentane phosphatase [Rhizobium paknamense]